MHRPRSLALILAVLVPALFLAACGGGGGGGGDERDASPLFSTTLLGNPDLDGWVSDSGLVYSTSNPVAGDTHADVGYRGFYAFDIRAVPAGARIVSATLRIHQFEVRGDPFATHGPLVLDHIDMGSELDAGDYSGSNIRAAFAVLSREATIGYLDADITERLEADIAAGRTHAAFRVRFGSLSSDNDGVRDLISLTDAEDSDNVGHVPHVLLRYELP